MAGVREQDLYMPIANVIRIMRRILPPHAKISDETKELIQECASEFISFITSEANDRCQREQRKTVSAEDLLWAMGKLGFDDYVQPLSLYLQRHRESEGEPASVRRTSSLAMPPPPQREGGNSNVFGYGFGGGLGFDFDQGYNRDVNAAAGHFSSGGFGPSFDYSFQHNKRDGEDI